MYLSFIRLSPYHFSDFIITDVEKNVNKFRYKEKNIIISLDRPRKACYNKVNIKY